MKTAPGIWQLTDRVLRPGERPLVMGIVNVTPDSFSDGGEHESAEAAVAHGAELVRQGADLLDIGGESSRPGSRPVPLDEELRRVLPVVRGLLPLGVPLSLDTTKAEVADRALHAGAHAVNDISALGDPDMPEVVRRRGAGLVLMHMRGTPETMQQGEPHYEDVASEVAAFLQARLQRAVDLGIAETRVVLDPGIGFGKTAEHNWELIAGLGALGALGRPVLLGVSRKGFLGRLLGREVGDRLAGSLACAAVAMARGAAHILRVHDVSATHDAVRVWQAIRERTEGWAVDRSDPRPDPGPAGPPV